MSTLFRPEHYRRTTHTLRGDFNAVATVWRYIYRIGFRLAKIWWFVRRPRHTGALAAIWSHSQLLVVRQSYRPTVCLPGGGVERGETPRAAAVRELAEELGLLVNPDDLTLVQSIDGISEFRRSHVEIYEMTLPHGPRVRVDGREIVEALLLNIPSLLHMRLDPILME